MAYGYGPLRRPVGETLAALHHGLMCAYRAECLPAYRRSPRRARKLRRIRGWSREIGLLLAQADRVTRETLPRIERDAGHTLRDPDGLLRVLMDASIRRLFSDIRAGFPEPALPVPAWDLEMLANLPDGAHVAAVIGDVTLQVKISGLHVEEAGLAALADRWGLPESRIGSPAGEPPVREKEFLARAVLGLLYVDGGTGALRAVVPLLGCGREE